MKKFTFFVTLITFLVLNLSVSGFAEEDWRDAYIASLEKGKAVQLEDTQEQSEGLAYTPPEDVVLEEAITKAMEKNAPACECLKIAIDFEYNPYSVLKNLYAAGGKAKLDQLCMCATEAGVMKAIIAQAAADAVSPLNDPIFDRDEIAQSQCLGGEEALAYTALDKPLPNIIIDRTPSKDPSTFTPN